MSGYNSDNPVHIMYGQYPVEVSVLGIETRFKSARVMLMEEGRHVMTVSSNELFYGTYNIILNRFSFI